MEDFFKEMEGKIVEAAIADFTKIREEVGDEQIYAVALVTAGDLSGLYLAVNTEEHILKRDAHNRELLIQWYKDRLSPEEFEKELEKLKDSTPETTKWIADEWGYPAGNYSSFGSIGREMLDKQSSLELDDEYDEFEKYFFQMVISDFKKLVQTDSFGLDKNKVTYFVTIGGAGDDAIEIENQSAKLLNPKDVYDKFAERYNVLTKEV